MAMINQMESAQINQIPFTELMSESEIISSWKGDINKPIVSIGCITYNHEKYIEDAIIGFLRQKTDFPFEILINDDASTDSTVAIIDKFKKLYPNLIKVIYQTENQYSQGKIPSGFNISRAKGRYFAICEGDDYWISDTHLNTAVTVLRSDEDASIFGCACFIKKVTSIKLILCKKTSYDLNQYILEAPFVATCSLVAKTDILNKLIDIPVLGGRYFAGDTRLKLISLTEGNMIISNHASVVYRKGSEGSWSNRVIEKNLIVRELLDNLAITREIGYLSGYAESEALYHRAHSELLIKGSQLAGLKGFFPWVKFVFLNLNVLSFNNIRVVLAANQTISKIVDFKKKWL